MLQLSRLSERGFQQQLWIILSLFLVKNSQIFSIKSVHHSVMFMMVYLGGKTGSSSYAREIFYYDYTSDSWNITGEMNEPRSYYGLSLLDDVY